METSSPGSLQRNGQKPGSRLRTFEEILVWATLTRHGKSDKNPSLVGKLVHLLEAFNHTIFPFCDVVGRATSRQQEAAGCYEWKGFLHDMSKHEYLVFVSNSVSATGRS